MPDSPSSNFGNAVGAAGGSALDQLGAVIGTIADFEGAAPVLGLIDAVLGLTTGDNSALLDLVQNVENAIQRLNRDLSSHLTGQDINTRYSNLGDALSDGAKVLQGLKADLTADLTKADVDDRLSSCSQSLDKLSSIADPESYLATWYAPVADQVYWTDYPNVKDPLRFDVGYDAQVPGPDRNAPPDNVYSYTLALTAFLQALCIWLTVAQALAASTFVADFSDSVLKPAWQFLKDQHDRIVQEGIVELVPAEYTPTPPGGQMPEGGPLPGGPVGTPEPIWISPGSGGSARAAVVWDANTLAAGGATIYDGPGSLPAPTDLPHHIPVTICGVTPRLKRFVVPGITRGAVKERRHPVSAWVIDGAWIEYGAVEVFSGYSSTARFFLRFGLPAGEILPTSTDKRPYNKLRLRAMKRRKDVYAGIGLPKLWETINSVGRLLGLAPIPRPSDAQWSLRAVGQIFGQKSMRAIAEDISRTVPYDTPKPGPGGVSFRSLLDV
jgi:hypothetical protein